MRLTLLTILLASITISAYGHSLYVEFPEHMSLNSPAELWIAYGHGGSTDQELSSLPLAKLISPDGQERDLMLEPFRGGLKGIAPLETSGCYILDLQMESSFFDPAWFGAAGSKSLVEKYGRALLPMESGKGFEWSKGEGLEIVPAVDPYSLRSGDLFSARVSWNRNPVAGSYSGVVTRTPDEILVIQHAQENDIEGSTGSGDMNFRLTKPGLWVLSFEATLDESGTWEAESDDLQGHYVKGEVLEYDQIAPTAYLTFWVTE